jgi:hypothetical protein
LPYDDESFAVFMKLMIFTVLTKLFLLPKLIQKRWFARECSEKALAMVGFFNSTTMAMNVVVTSHLPVCLYSAAGGKVNRQVARTRRTVTR